MVNATAFLRKYELAEPASQRDLSIDYLRTTLTLIVLAHHSALAYTSFAGSHWQNMILADVTRWVFFDYVDNFNEVFVMSLMFFVSGLFVYPALRRHGVAGFIRDRSFRLGVPFAIAVAFVVPIAYYPSWRANGHNTGLITFCKLLVTERVAIGPPWSVWELLFFDVVLALTMMPLRRWMPSVERLMPRLRNHSFAACVALVSLSTLAYVPLLSRYGYAWANFITWPFSFQISRIGLYSLWFLFGFFVGTPGLADGLLAHNGTLARHWPQWGLACILFFNALRFVPSRAAGHALAAPHIRGLGPLLWVVSCAASCFGFVAVFRGVKLHTSCWMKSLTRSAYVMYLVHYAFITWTQRLVWNRPIHASIKFVFVFLATTLLSWLTAQAVLRVPKLRTIF